MTRTIPSIFALTCGLCVAGLCAGPSAVARRVNRSATVAGAVKLCGPGQHHSTCGIDARAREIVARSQGHRVASQLLRHGRFRLHLVPGRYTIEVVTTHGPGGRRKNIRARAHRTTVVNFYKYVR